MKKAVIFDFDGTMADTEGILRDIYNEIAKQKKWKVLNNHDYRKLFTSTIWHAIKWSKLRPWRFYYLIKQSRQQLHTEAGRISFFKGIPQLIDKLYQADYDLYVLSYNVESTIELVLTNREVIDKLTVLDQAVFFHKHIRINEIVKLKKYDKHNVWMVGDEVRDIIAGKKARVNTLAVTWGFGSRRVLKQHRPTAIADKPSEIFKIINS